METWTGRFSMLFSILQVVSFGKTKQSLNSSKCNSVLHLREHVQAFDIETPNAYVSRGGDREVFPSQLTIWSNAVS